MSQITIDCKDLSPEQMYYLALVRAGFKCEKKQCEHISNLEVHHKDKNGAGLNNNRKLANNHPDNLIILCKYHHAKEHRNHFDKKLPFVVFLMESKGVSQTFLSGSLNITQPAISQFLNNGNKSLKRYIQVKDFINDILKTNYTIDELFEYMNDVQANALLKK